VCKTDNLSLFYILLYSAQETDQERRERLRAKVRSVSKMMRMYAVLRAERETIVHLKSIAPGKKIPQGLLSKVSHPSKKKKKKKIE
jgi:hypothetical protein